MNKSELISAVAAKSGQSAADVTAAIDGLKSVLADALKAGDKVAVPGFITVERVERGERSGRNPATGEAMTIAARSAVKITPGKDLKSAVA